MMLKQKKSHATIKEVKSKPMRDEHPSESFGRVAGSRILLIAALVLIVALASPVVLRMLSGYPPLTTGESYYNLRLAQLVKSDPFITQDPIQQTHYLPNPYHYLLALILAVVSSDALPLFFPLALGLFSSFLFYKILLILGTKRDEAAFALIILAVSPAFIVLFTGLYAAGFMAFLSLLITWLIIKPNKSKYELLLCILLFFLLAISSLAAFIITFLIVLAMCLALKRKLSLVLIPFIPSLAAIIIMAPFLSYNLITFGFHTFEFRNIISVLRADVGFDIFLLMLFAIGFVRLWTTQEYKRLLHLAVLAFIALSFFNAPARVFSTFIIIAYCVSAIVYFYNRKWELEIIRTGTLFLVICSLVFALVNQVNLLVQSQPDREMKTILQGLKELPGGLVLTDEKEGFLVEFYSGKKVFLDANSRFFPGYNEKQEPAMALFSTVRLREATPIILEHDFRYFLITPAMKAELWEDREQGLWFLMSNSYDFIRYSKSEGIELWAYSPENVE